jgi:hypothetical protein
MRPQQTYWLIWPLSIVMLGLCAHVASAKKPDLTGTWAVKRLTRVVDSAPFIGKFTVDMETIALFEGRAKGLTFTTREKVCRVAMSSSSSSIKASPMPGLAKAVSGNKRVFRLSRDKDGYLFHYPKQATIWGARLKNAATDPLPTDPKDARVIDVDGDGKPGMTIRIGGLVSGDFHIVQRDVEKWIGSVRSPNRIEGSIRWSFERSILDKTSAFLPSKNHGKADHSSKNNRFILQRVGRKAKCEDILKSPDAFFAPRSQAP